MAGSPATATFAYTGDRMSPVREAISHIKRHNVQAVIRALRAIIDLPCDSDLDRHQIRVIKSTIVQLELFAKILPTT